MDIKRKFEEPHIIPLVELPIRQLKKIKEKRVASNIHNKKEFYITQLLTKAAIQIYVIYLEYDVLKNNVYCNDY